jgi:hypothetical protein
MENFYINDAQMKAIMLNAHIQINFMGRGTGKSAVVLPYKLQRNATLMPRGCGTLLVPNYQKALQDLLPPVFSGWERMGYKRNVHYFVGERPPKKWNLPTPYLEPGRYDYSISWFNGHVFNLVSQDKSVTNNGKSVDYIKGDEGKLLKRNKFIQESLPTLRGNQWLWGHLPEYGGIEFFSDKYFDGRGGNWLLDVYGHLHDEELAQAIYQQQAAIEFVRNKNPFDEALVGMEEKLRKMQSMCVALVNAPSTDNRYALGPQFFKTQAESMNIVEFKGSIMNMEIGGTGDFYVGFDVDVHGYWPVELGDGGLASDMYKSVERCGEMDSDCISADPLVISVDWGGSINSMGIYQHRSTSIDKINELYCKPPEKYQDLARKFCYYYRYHAARHLTFLYDPSGNATRADDTQTFAEEFADILRANRWEVDMVSIGAKNVSHARKHRLWAVVLNESNGQCTDHRFKVFRINRLNCPNSIISIGDAGLKITKGTYEKDKSSERKSSGVLPEHATHFSDGDDIMMVHYQIDILEMQNNGYSIG